MKKVVIFLLSLLVLIGCTNDVVVNPPNNLTLKLDTNDLAIKHLSLEINGVGLENTTNADQSAFKSDDIIYFEIPRNLQDKPVDLAFSYSTTIDGTNSLRTNSLSIAELSTNTEIILNEKLHIEIHNQ